jgi:hypothetical protein
MSLLVGHLDSVATVEFLEVAAGKGRRGLAKMFFSSLCFHNRGVVRLEQNDWRSPILISRGRQYRPSCHGAR